MENTPAGCGSDLHTILGIFKNKPKSRSVSIFVQRLDFDPNSVYFMLPANAPPSTGCWHIYVRTGLRIYHCGRIRLRIGV